MITDEPDVAGAVTVIVRVKLELVASNDTVPVVMGPVELTTLSVNGPLVPVRVRGTVKPAPNVVA